ncbi:MAG: LysR family transcriptional regulator [Methyloligellaceae bacterium]
MSSDVTLRQLRYFVAAAETGQFSMAASKCYVSQSAITNAILSLESRLQGNLFTRKPHGVELTAEGQRFYRHASHVLNSLQDALREPRIRADNLDGSVRIAASYTVLGYFLPPLMARFRAHYPDVNLDLHDIPRETIEAKILSDELDLGIVILSNVEDTSRFNCHTLMRTRRQLWAASDHPVLKNQFPALSDIAEHPYILLTQDDGESSDKRFWLKSNLSPDIAFRTNVMEALRGLVAHGFGITILSDMVYRPWSLEGKKIEARPILDPIPHMEVGLIWAKNKTFDDATEEMKLFLIQSCD